ncbi:MAG: filamentous hemagglutinin [Alkalinema sp. CACIAM 70d]|nr:MAG: filamentous hemagglutinin [Alkalinema sp. CACIAM 70d]
MKGTIAQVLPDGSLPTSVTNSNNLNFTINGGARSGDNLFHSFSQFSVPTGGSAFFNNALDVQNIFARVTGGTTSNIDGTLKANGSANLFLLNPSGVLFGPNAKLNIGGSFIGTTANSIQFADGTVFSAVSPSGSPLLTISAPIGLQMGSNPTPIAVQGTGYALTASNSLAPLTQNPSASELRVNPGKTLALVGGNLNLSGATLNAPQGRVELGSLSGAGLVSLTPIAQGYQLGYQNGQSFGDINLNQKSVLTIGALPSVGALNAGSVQLQGRQIQFSDGSLIFSKNLGTVAGGEIVLQASEGIDIVGTTANAQIRSGIRTEALNTGTGSSIRIVAPRLTLSQGAGINNNAFGFAASGSIQIDAGTVEVSGSSQINPTGVTSLTTSSRTAKSAGNLTINSNNLLVSGGAAISSIAFASGASGQVTVRSTETTITGDNPAGLYSNISAITYGIGNAQTVTLDTARLQLLNGGAVSTTSFLIGQAGDLNINATESILISGRSKLSNSSINSAVIPPEPLLQKLFSLPNILSANSGNVNINTPTLTLTNGGTVSVTNPGTGNGGTISIAANILNLDRQGSLAAATKSGEGGNISLQIRDLLLMRRGSFISTTAGGTGNGGDIILNTPIIVGLENSDIIANAFQGRGGNIHITTQNILGLKFRDRLTPENDITASSEFGLSGNVQVNTIGVDPNAGLTELPVNVADPSQKIATGCSSTQGSQFVATGRGGVPQNPNQQVMSDRTWNDLRDLSAYRGQSSTVAASPADPSTLVQASGFQHNADGTISLIASPTTVSASSIATCSHGSIITATVYP